MVRRKIRKLLDPLFLVARTLRNLSQSYPDAILIDDDPLVRALWRQDAKREGKHLEVFSSAPEFLRVSENFNLQAPIFIDSDLGDIQPGEKSAKEFHSRGFKHIHLATGHAPSDFPEMDWIKSIVGKDPVWK